MSYSNSSNWKPSFKKSRFITINLYCCKFCNGKKTVTYEDWDGFDFLGDYTESCQACDGLGRTKKPYSGRVLKSEANNIIKADRDKCGMR